MTGAPKVTTTKANSTPQKLYGKYAERRPGEQSTLPGVSGPVTAPAGKGQPLSETSSKVEGRETNLAAADPNILAAISDPRIQAFVCRVLGGSGLTAIRASSLSEACKILLHEKVSLVICAADIQDGTFRDLLSLARKIPAGVVTLCTGSCSSHSRIDALELGILDYVSYPLPAEELQWVVRSALAKISNLVAIAAAS
ncbi:MAG: response regulator [Acidobacteria bacterium]|nr:MAG: response regulator [Acidobacteriota bacterium]